MAKVTVEVPEELAGAIRKVTKEPEAGLTAMGSGKPMKFAEWERRAASSASQMVRRLLQRLDLDVAHVKVDGRIYARVGRYPATYRTQAGPVEVTRSRYREVGERNARTVDAVLLRSGCVEKSWLPETVRARACGVQHLARGARHCAGRPPAALRPRQLQGRGA